MTKEIKEIRDNKISEMIIKINHWENQERDLIKNGKHNVEVIDGRKYVTFEDEVYTIIRNRIDYVTESLKFLSAKCNLSKPQIVRRLAYMQKKNELDFDVWLPITRTLAAVRNN